MIRVCLNDLQSLICWRRVKNRVLSCLAILVLVANASAFSLLGPYADWMQPTNGFNRYYGESGGPMDLGEEYRWNVPVLTYAFDQSFLDYFGSNGVSAVEQAIQIFNDLPPASAMVLTAFPLITEAYNFPAGAQQVYDLKSAVMELLIEQLGLAQPARNVFALRRFDPALFLPFCESEICWRDWAIPYYIVERNFDPVAVAPSHWVNGTLYSGFINRYSDSTTEFWVFPVYDTAIVFNAVADKSPEVGKYRTGLTRDDVGGLRYLLSPTNINFETLLPDVHGVGSNANSYVNGAWRPGVDKVGFQRQEYNSLLHQGVPLTNQFADIYITNGLVMTQLLERVVMQPDFLFSVSGFEGDHSPYGPLVSRNSATNWLNLAALNGDATKAGPGLIRPPGEIYFFRMGALVSVYELWNTNQISFAKSVWGSFAGSTNIPITYPTLGLQNPDHFNVALFTGATGPGKVIKWKLPVAAGNTAVLELSTNLSDWSRIATITNLGIEIGWYDRRVKPTQFYRVVPQ